MKITRVRIENYRSIRSEEFEFPQTNMLVLVGANNAGKSNIISAIDAMCGDTWYGREKIEPHDHFLRDPNREIKIHLFFDDGRRVKWSSKEKWPAYTYSNGEKTYTNIKDDFPCIYLGADRILDRHINFNEWTLLSKIKRHFHKEAAALGGELAKRYQEVVALFKEVKGFTNFLEGFGDTFSELQADTPAKLSIDFKPYTPTNFFKSLQILVQDPQQGGGDVGLEELGEGSRNVVLLALLLSYAKFFKATPGIVALEEPELFLHPHARRHLMAALREIAAGGHQVILSTHSTSFVDTEEFDSIGQVVKKPDPQENGARSTKIRLVSRQALVEHCKSTGVPAHRVTKENITPFYRATATAKLNEGFFSRCVVLVEGETEELALPVLLGHVGVDCDRHGVSIINVNGKSNLPRYWRMFSAFAIPTLVVFDNDKGGDDEAPNKDIASCMGLNVSDFLDGLNICKTVEAKRPSKTPLVVIDDDFESAVKADYAAWAKSNPPADSDDYDRWTEEARRFIRQGKGLIARFVVARMCDEQPDFVPLLADAVAQRLALALGIKLTRTRTVAEAEIPF
jgi:putative ATP-dependent endonuclease of OLD family